MMCLSRLPKNIAAIVACLALLLALPGVAQAEPAAQIISLQGKGETKAAGQPAWAPAAVQQALEPGSYVRTGDLSNMALLFRDQTQVRLQQNSQMQIKSVADAADGNLQTAVKLHAGRAWVQAKNVSGRAKMETPTATLAIRGTDWDIQVDDDGKSTLTVLSGSIEFFNEHGGVMVQPGEQAVAESGKAPVKWLISNPGERVQWVTAYSVDPLRHIRLSEDSPAAVLYDLRRWDEAAAAFRQALALDGNDMLAKTGLALLALRADDVAGAERWLKVVGCAERREAHRSGCEDAANDALRRLSAYMDSSRLQAFSR
ncbi:MAG: hypothetical protein EPN21_20550 [Methylococcaceae bacterium]|nr:MAG: hypothetical protein EPN21_20550 [Methylococcaceae bacterium]